MNVCLSEEKEFRILKTTLAVKMVYNAHIFRRTDGRIAIFEFELNKYENNVKQMNDIAQMFQSFVHPMPFALSQCPNLVSVTIFRS